MQKINQVKAFIRTIGSQTMMYESSLQTIASLVDRKRNLKNFAMPFIAVTAKQAKNTTLQLRHVSSLRTTVHYWSTGTVALFVVALLRHSGEWPKSVSQSPVAAWQSGLGLEFLNSREFKFGSYNREYDRI